MSQSSDIRVRKGAGRPHRINLALDRLRERQGATTLRLVLQANLPRGQGRPSRLQYQRLTSYLVDCGSPAAVTRVREALANLMDKLSDPAEDEQCLPIQPAQVRRNIAGKARSTVPSSRSRRPKARDDGTDLSAAKVVVRRSGDVSKQRRTCEKASREGGSVVANGAYRKRSRLQGPFKSFRSLPVSARKQSF